MFVRAKSTYFESDPPFDGLRRHGYSRDRRSDCVQVVIALIVTPQGFPLAYEVMPGNTGEKSTLADHRLLLRQLDLQLPEQPAPRIALRTRPSRSL